jgi:hypothetical protein
LLNGRPEGFPVTTPQVVDFKSSDISADVLKKISGSGDSYKYFPTVESGLAFLTTNGKVFQYSVPSVDYPILGDSRFIVDPYDPLVYVSGGMAYSDCEGLAPCYYFQASALSRSGKLWSFGYWPTVPGVYQSSPVKLSFPANVSSFTSICTGKNWIAALAGTYPNVCILTPL